MDHSLYYFFNVCLFWERKSERGWARERRRERDSQKAPCCQCRAQRGAWSHELRDHYLTRNQESDTNWATQVTWIVHFKIDSFKREFHFFSQQAPCPTWGLNSQSWDQESHILLTESARRPKNYIVIKWKLFLTPGFRSENKDNECDWERKGNWSN